MSWIRRNQENITDRPSPAAMETNRSHGDQPHQKQKAPFSCPATQTQAGRRLDVSEPIWPRLHTQQGWWHSAWLWNCPPFRQIYN